jgi:hypothetical protein
LPHILLLVSLQEEEGFQSEFGIRRCSTLLSNLVVVVVVVFFFPFGVPFQKIATVAEIQRWVLRVSVVLDM